MTLMIERECEDENGRTIPVGTVVDYIGHVPGGMVRIRWRGQDSIIHPGATKELK